MENPKHVSSGQSLRQGLPGRKARDNIGVVDLRDQRLQLCGNVLKLSQQRFGILSRPIALLSEGAHPQPVADLAESCLQLSTTCQRLS